MTTTVETFLRELVAFADAVDAIVLDGAGGSSLRVCLSARSPAATELQPGDVVDVASAAASLGSTSAARMFGDEGHVDPRWSWRLEVASASDVVRTVANETRSIVRELGRSKRFAAEHRALAGAGLEAKLAELVEGAVTFNLVCTHQITCCGTALYVLERPETFVVFAFYRFC